MIIIIRIVPISHDTLVQAERLVAQVFPFQNLAERLSFTAFAKKDNRIVRVITRLFGVNELINFWVALNETNRVVGTTGLYSYLRDCDEAVWLAWFCVAPNERGKGIGKQLLAFSIEEARKIGLPYLRLYTGDDPIEREAQRLYERFGLKEIRRERKLFYSKIFRELRLKRI
ncbi:MAG: GNAT family N-acetyltransferase [Bacillota bacterium]